MPHNGTILVIDDEDIMREILETLLSREGYDVRLASSGAEGLALARNASFDAAIVARLRNEFFAIGPLTAERLKIERGSFRRWNDRYTPLASFSATKTATVLSPGCQSFG